ncbi:MAG: hopanoid biosynthesis-associated protein HpnK [Candidatus Eremiobacteraeota bacterium]|nr:hopanoid biosynthesis-associated protein HpnK [Candidatus Eremiobacteraeota bacterium]MBV8375229.1 hopanoid biosynthesis-associated protein HpnK [Candidatus Eremiobacteraeota bacterium]
MKRVILNADDFGISPQVNEAVERAHREGMLRAASLMVGAPAFADALERARRLPSLAVGLHVVLVNGRPVLPPERVPSLVDGSGAFSNHLVQAGIRFFFHPGIRRQLDAEVRAQFERFAETGLALDHVNAQSHMHVHPAVFASILRVGCDYGMRAIRIPCEPYGGTRTIAPWIGLMRVRARRSGIVCNDYVFGVNDVGAMTEARILRMLDRLPDGVTELFFHPATARFAGADLGTERFAWSEELAALTSARVRAAIADKGIESTTYGELARNLQCQ